MKPTTIGHVMILASAGSGKTYALTNRFVKLLALGAAPERIVALTFTRKAAGEFFDEILNKLARAASEPAYARALAEEIGWSEMAEGAVRSRAEDELRGEVAGTRGMRRAAGDGGVRRPRPTTEAAPDFLRLLRAVVDAMHRLRLGTLDGFFARVARNFPLELGLSGEFEILQEHAARMERGRVLRRMFERTGELADAQREFIEAFKRATFGADEKRLGAQLDAFLDAHQEIFLAAPVADLWGNPARIWPEGTAWSGRASQRAAAAAALRAALATEPLSELQRDRWETFFAALESWSPGADLGDLEYLSNNILKAWPEMAEIVVERKKFAPSERTRAALREVVHAIVAAEMERRLEMTRGIHAVLQGYEAVYHDAVRRAGKLTFGDVQRLLMPGGEAPSLSSGSGRRVSEEESRQDAGAPADDRRQLAAAAAEERLAIDYRLDAGIDHWLLDEFQDTSFGQWSVLRNLIDEVVQDPTGTRSFFYVGDVKQAIFAWREGDPRLFREIFNHYNAAHPGTIAEEHLVRSWRSGPPVIAAVNRVFGDAAVLAELFPGAASRTWNEEWRAHESAKPELGGHAALLHAAAGGGRADEELARFATALAVLEEIAPLERGLSCALLVQDNATAARLADYLRREGGLRAIAESDLHVCTDNPLGCALLALAKAAAHPGDTLAQEHLRMTPLGAVLAAEGLETAERLTTRVLREIHAEGFERTMSAWVRQLEPALAADDAFSRERARQFTAAAGLFDATGSRDVAEFIAFMERHTVRDSDTAAVLRVMTIHKSKGLGFDVVILPDLEGMKLELRRDGLAVQKSADRAVEWILDLPAKIFHAQDAVLSAHVRTAEADACYECLSLLYVAMTRAKRAMYLITKPPGKSTSRNYPKLLAETLGEETTPVRVGRREFAGAFAVGDADWPVALKSTKAPAENAAANEEAAAERRAANAEIPLLDRAKVRVAPRLPARRPSAGKRAELAGARAFSLERGNAAEFGTAVHALLAEVEWGGAETVTRLAGEWKARKIPAEVAAQALAGLRAPALAEIWTPPAESHERHARTEVWRERAFEVVIDGTWITGVFDRVVVTRDVAGRATAATVIDFKTDRVGAGVGSGGGGAAGSAGSVAAEIAALAAKHAAQLELYRRVAAVLTRLPREKVEGVLVFTHARIPVRMEQRM